MTCLSDSFLLFHMALSPAEKEERRYVDGVDEHQQYALAAADPAGAASGKGDEERQDAEEYRGNHLRERYADGADDGRDGDDEEVVEDVAAQHRADADFVVAPDFGQHRRGQLGHGGAERHERRADDEVVDAEFPGDAGRGEDDQPPGGDKQQETRDNMNPGHEAIRRRRAAVGWRSLPERLLDRHRHPRRKSGQHEHPFEPVDHAVDEQNAGQERRQNRDRHIPFEHLGADRNAGDEQRDAENERDVDDVAAKRVAERELGFSGQPRVDRHGEFGTRSREGGHRHPDDRGGDAQHRGDPRRASDEQLAAKRGKRNAKQ